MKSNTHPGVRSDGHLDGPCGNRAKNPSTYKPNLSRSTRYDPAAKQGSSHARSQKKLCVCLFSSLLFFSFHFSRKEKKRIKEDVYDSRKDPMRLVSWGCHIVRMLFISRAVIVGVGEGEGPSINALGMKNLTGCVERNQRRYRAYNGKFLTSPYNTLLPTSVVPVPVQRRWDCQGQYQSGVPTKTLIPVLECALGITRPSRSAPSNRQVIVTA